MRSRAGVKRGFSRLSDRIGLAGTPTPKIDALASGPGTWTAPADGIYRFRLYGAGGPGSASSGGGGGAACLYSATLNKGTEVSFTIGNPTSVTIPGDRVLIAGMGQAGTTSGGAGGTASGGDINSAGGAGGAVVSVGGAGANGGGAGGAWSNPTSSNPGGGGGCGGTGVDDWARFIAGRGDGPTLAHNGVATGGGGASSRGGGPGLLLIEYAILVEA